jgi:hypothetical protein
MRSLILPAALLSFLTLNPAAPGTAGDTGTNTLVKAGDGLWFMYYDSSKSKSTVVEFDAFLAMIEVPVKDQGGNARVLEEHAEGGEKALRTLRERFPSKPLRYVIHSHWHPHSISSVKPFLENGTTLVTTRENFARLREFVDSATAAGHAGRIAFVEGDSLVIEAPGNRIVVHRFTQKEYPNAPTADYLYSYLPKYNYLHCSCMYNKWTGGPVEGRELLTGREEDIGRFLEARGLAPASLIRLTVEKEGMNDLQPYEGLKDVLAHGISAGALTDRYLALDERTIRTSRDSLLAAIARDNIPASVINRAVYAAVERDETGKAAELAALQAMARPSDANAWDTLGEVLWIRGDTLMARHYGEQAKAISPAFTGGGEGEWKKNQDVRLKKRKH